MKVILLQKVPGLGNEDEVKEVSDGYAKNFLFPKHLAVLASKQAVDQVESRQKRLVKEANRELELEQALAEKIDGRDIIISEKADKSGSLYAGVNAAKVADALKKMGFEIDKKQIKMKPIKSAGEYKAMIKFSHGLEVEINITVNATK